MAAPKPFKWDLTVGLAAGAIFVGWVAFGAAQLRHWSSWPLAVGSSLLAVAAYQRGRTAAAERHAGLKEAAAVAAARGRELELLRGVASALLSFRSSDELFREVARFAKELTKADGAAVLLRLHEERFLRVTSGEGLLRPAVGKLLPLDGSLVGAAFIGADPIRVDRMQDDPRNHPVEGVDATIGPAAITAFRSGGVRIGVIGVYRGGGSSSFSEYDLTLLKTVADQLEIGLDRAEMVEEAKRNQLALEESNRELVKATQLKSQFLANMSHELRTPLNAIIGFADMIRDDQGLDETQRDYLDSIARNGRHLLDLINSVLDVARLEAGRMTIRLAPVDMRLVIRAAVSDTESLRAVKRQTCEMEMGDDPVEIQADGQKVRQVLINLLSNASKFTGEGGLVTTSLTTNRVPLPTTLDQDGRSNGVAVRDAVCVSVRDNGIGIEKDDVGRLFQAFSQLDSSASRAQQGSGLGLALCRQLIELHGGTIGVDSKPGEGSSFWFVLPVAGPLRGAG
jgi:signal transduction histidine kinase